jgi:hypothetical protein
MKRRGGERQTERGGGERNINESKMKKHRRRNRTEKGKEKIENDNKKYAPPTLPNAVANKL